MNRDNRVRGAVPTPVIAVIVAVVAIGGALYFISEGFGPGAADVDSVGFTRVEMPVLVEPPARTVKTSDIPKKTPQAEEILKGGLIKFHDENGTVRFRTRETVEGIDANGRKLVFQPVLTLGPAVGRAESGTKELRRKGAAPPRVKFNKSKGSVQAAPQAQPATGEK